MRCHNARNPRPGILLLALLLLLMSCLFGCGWQRRKSDQELGLNPQQARGRRVFDQQCSRCHDAYSSWSWNGPSLQHVLKKPYLPSGIPANDERVRELVVLGKTKMPSFGKVLDDQQLDDLLAYLHTL